MYFLPGPCSYDLRVYVASAKTLLAQPTTIAVYVDSACMQVTDSNTGTTAYIFNITFLTVDSSFQESVQAASVSRPPPTRGDHSSAANIKD